VRPFLEGANVLAVPLEAGGGTRLKILEAFAAGLPVVSTPIGAEGIAAEHGEHLVIAPRTEFGAAIAGLLERPAAGLALARSAQRLAESVYDWRGVGRQAAEAIEGLF
jgi:glycosyltransferase involved in cell wall biosynthesis